MICRTYKSQIYVHIANSFISHQINKLYSKIEIINLSTGTTFQVKYLSRCSSFQMKCKIIDKAFCHIYKYGIHLEKVSTEMGRKNTVTWHISVFQSRSIQTTPMMQIEKQRYEKRTRSVLFQQCCKSQKINGTLLYVTQVCHFQFWKLLFSPSVESFAHLRKLYQAYVKGTGLSSLCFLTILQANGMLPNVISMEKTHSSPKGITDTVEFQAVGWRMLGVGWTCSLSQEIMLTLMIFKYCNKSAQHIFLVFLNRYRQ